MRRTWIALCFVLSLLLPGCANWKQAAHKGTGVIVITADAAMKSWAGYVATGQAKPEQEAKVKAAYEKYQKAALTLIAAGKAATANGNRTAFDVAVAATSAAQADLVGLVQSFVPSKLQPRPTPPTP